MKCGLTYSVVHITKGASYEKGLHDYFAFCIFISRSPGTGGLDQARDAISLWTVSSLCPGFDESWAGGRDGLLIHSTDGGESWDSIPNGSEKSILTIEFVNVDTGFIAGRDNGSTGLPGSNSLIQRTTDGGLSWEWQTFPGASQNTLMDIDFVEGPPGEAMRGFCVGGLAHVWTTRDYGETWEAASGDCGEGNFNSCYFTDSITGWFVGTPSNVKPYTIMYTEDGTASFVEQTDPNEIKLNGVCFGAALKGIAVGNNGVIIYTSDGGLTWENSMDEDIKSTMWTSVHLNESGLAWAVDSNGKIAYSSDWGHSWELQESGVSEILWEVFFLNDMEGWAVGGMAESVVLHTKNGGVTSTGIKETEDVFSAYSSLEQNFPNPFDASTQISYQLQYFNIYTLCIYDLSGRKIQTLVNEFQTAGKHSVGLGCQTLKQWYLFLPAQG